MGITGFDRWKGRAGSRVRMGRVYVGGRDGREILAWVGAIGLLGGGSGWGRDHRAGKLSNVSVEAFEAAQFFFETYLGAIYEVG